MAANVGHNGTGRVAEPVGAHEEWRTVGGLLVAQNSCRLCLVCTRIRWPGLNLIFFWHQSINQLCIYACTCTCVIAHAPQAFGIVERAWVCAYAVRVAGVVLVSRPFASSRFEPAASNPQKLSCAKRSALHWHISKSQGSSRGIAR